ncbi:hypothetical protein [Nocardia callitridis]|uniref:hypothetical protein n=1 Tax=Nocardia callitridis TaxID=648753 RepID=UPI0031E9A31B
MADGDPAPYPPNHGHCYFATDEDLVSVRERALGACAVPDSQRGEIGAQPWDERP